MGNNQSRAVIGSLTLMLATCACAPTPRDTGFPDAGPCIVDDDPDRGSVAEQAIAIADPPSGLELFLDEDSGGPLRCRPSVAVCPALEDCVGVPVQLPVGIDATLAVGLRTITAGFSGQVIDVVFEAGSDPSFTLLSPFPSELPPNGDETFIFVGIRPLFEGIVTARVLITADALNVPAGPVGITLKVEGVSP